MVRIKVTLDEQFNTDGIAARGNAYGMKTIRVDGNDALAVIHATRMAREYIVKEKKPVFLEAMTYRVGDHSTSDYSALYREEDEIDSWRVTNDPIKRLGNYLQAKKAFPYTEETLQALRKEILSEVATSLKKQSSTKLPKADLLFEQVYDKPTENLIQQRDECRKILTAYSEELGANKYEQ